MSHQPQHTPLPYQEATDEQQLSPYRFVIAGLVVLLHLSFGLTFFAVSPITPLIIEEYGINRGTAGLLTSLVILVQAGFSIPGSLLVGRIGLKKLIALGSLLASAPSLTFLTGEFPLLLALRAIYGLGFAVVFPATGPLVMQWFSRKELPLVNGLGIAVASLGISISTFSVAPMSAAIGWKAALSSFGGVSLVSAACWLLLGRTRREGRRRESSLSLKGAWGVLRSRTTLLLAAADAGPFALYSASVAWLPTFYHEVHGMSLSRAGSLVGLLSVTGVVSVVTAGLLAMRVRRRRPFLIVPGIMSGFAGFGSVLLAGTAVVYPALAALGFVSWFYLPILLTIPMVLPGTSPERASLTLAIILTLGGFLSFLAPITVGATTDLLGTYLPGFALFSVLAWGLAVAGALLPETSIVGRERDVPKRMEWHIP